MKLFARQAWAVLLRRGEEVLIVAAMLTPRRFISFVVGCVALFRVLAHGLSPVVVPPPAVSTRNVDDHRLSELESETGDRPVDSILEQALAYDERGQAVRAIELYRQAAAQGVGVAELRLGWFDESGVGGEQSYALARAHYEKAAEQGVLEANMRLGLLSLDGWGTKKIRMPQLRI